MKSGLKGNRSDAEDLVLERLREMLPPTVTSVTMLADRGFGDVRLYEGLAGWGWDFVIRFRGCIFVTSSEGEERTAADWLHPNGRARKLKGMKDAWYLASSLGGHPAGDIIKLYGRRFTIEENFRDAKDCDRRARMRSSHSRWVALPCPCSRSVRFRRDGWGRA